MWARGIHPAPPRGFAWLVPKKWPSISISTCSSFAYTVTWAPGPGSPHDSKRPETRASTPSTADTAPEQSTGPTVETFATPAWWPPPKSYGRCRRSSVMARSRIVRTRSCAVPGAVTAEPCFTRTASPAADGSTCGPAAGGAAAANEIVSWDDAPAAPAPGPAAPAPALLAALGLARALAPLAGDDVPPCGVWSAADDGDGPAPDPDAESPPEWPRTCRAAFSCSWYLPRRSPRQFSTSAIHSPHWPGSCVSRPALCASALSMNHLSWSAGCVG